MSIFNDTIGSYTDKGYIHIAYGAAAKGTVFYNMTTRVPKLILDDNELKWGGLLPGFKDVTICSPNKLIELVDRPLVISIPAWNFRQEVINKVRSYTTNPNVRYVTWFPEVTVYRNAISPNGGGIVEECAIGE